jgi:ribosomal protein S18 acetylase RimI-like enzyme
MPTTKPTVTIRRARATDAARIAELSTQLGYPVTMREMAVRLKLVLREKKAACFVAEEKSAGVIGWIHVSTMPLVEVPVRAEVNGLVVDEKVRSQGAGWALLQAAEAWARKHHCKYMSVRSNVLRDRAHAFYERHGYEHYKTQKAFRKAL